MKCGRKPGWFAEWSEGLLEFFAGSRSQWYRLLLPLYGSWNTGELQRRIDRERSKVMQRYVFCIAAAVLAGLAILWNVGGSTDEEAGLTRLTLEYAGVEQEVLLETVPEVENRRLTGAEKKQVLRQTRGEISRAMLGKNPGWDQVSGRLHFVQNTESGVFVRYEISDPLRIASDGRVDGIGTGSGVDVTIGVSMILEDVSERFTISARVVPPQTEEDVKQALQMRAERIRAASGGDGTDLTKQGSTAEELYKSAESDGIAVSEERKDHSLWMVAFLMTAMLCICFFGRFQEVERQKVRRKEQITEQLPLLMDQLVLMMNAGLILSEALELSAGSFPEMEDGEDGALFHEIRMICRRAEETRRPVTSLLCEYAAETGVSELVRFSNMLADHVNRGSSSLIRQLKMERNYAVERQWSRKEGRCRQMEVRLAGPLTLLLAVILLLAAGPVWIGI